MSDASRAIQVFRAEHAQVFAALWRRLGEFDLVDAALADAYLAATASWPATGVPQNPMSWMSTVAMSATTSVLAKRGPELVDPGSPADDIRALLYGCAHPRLTAEERVVCTVRAAVGLVQHEIAALLGLPEATVNARLTSAKRTMRQPGAGLGPVAPEERAAREALVRDTFASIAAAKGSEAAAVTSVLATRIGQAF